MAASGFSRVPATRPRRLMDPAEGGENPQGFEAEREFRGQNACHRTKWMYRQLLERAFHAQSQWAGEGSSSKKSHLGWGGRFCRAQLSSVPTGALPWSSCWAPPTVPQPGSGVQAFCQVALSRCSVSDRGRSRPTTGCGFGRLSWGAGAGLSSFKWSY